MDSRTNERVPFGGPSRVARRWCSQAPTKALIEQIDRLRWDNNGQKIADDAVPKTFSLKWTTRLPRGKGRSSAGVLDGIAAGIEDFYGKVAEGIRPFVPKAPQLPKGETKKEEVAECEAAQEQACEAEALTPPPFMTSTTPPAPNAEPTSQEIESDNSLVSGNNDGR